MTRLQLLSTLLLPAVVACGASYSDDPNAERELPPVRFRHNHLGFDLAAPKRAVIEATVPLSDFVVTSVPEGDEVLAGELNEVLGFEEWGGGPRYYVADFSALDSVGEYRLAADGEESEPFEVAEHLLFSTTASDVVEYFRQSRADDPEVWEADQSASYVGRNGTHDVRGGWYDAAGDISKYLSHLSFANYLNPQQIPLVAWALAWVHDVSPELVEDHALDGRLVDEALWGADYLLRDQDPDGYFYINVFDRWTGDIDDRKICAFSDERGTRTADFQAAYREGGGLAIAALARISRWGQAGAFEPSEYLEGARRGFAHLEAYNTEYCDNGRENIIDDYSALFAAVELYAASGEVDYLAAARRRAASLIERAHPDGYFVADGARRPFWHASDAGLPVVALVRYLEVEASRSAARSDAGPPLDVDDQVEQAGATIRAHLDYLVRVTRDVPNPYGYARQHLRSGGSLRTGFFMPRDNETNYWWQGENARLASIAAALFLGGRAVAPDGSAALGVPPPYAQVALDQLDWILGKNPDDRCFLRGFGRNNPPAYCASKPQHGTLRGGISAGYTGSETDGSGIRGVATVTFQCWDEWRWVEQWLPHATWYLVATTALAGQP